MNPIDRRPGRSCGFCDADPFDLHGGQPLGAQQPCRPVIAVAPQIDQDVDAEPAGELCASAGSVQPGRVVPGGGQRGEAALQWRRRCVPWIASRCRRPRTPAGSSCLQPGGREPADRMGAQQAGQQSEPQSPVRPGGSQAHGRGAWQRGRTGAQGRKQGCAIRRRRVGQGVDQRAMRQGAVGCRGQGAADHRLRFRLQAQADQAACEVAQQHGVGAVLRDQRVQQRPRLRVAVQPRQRAGQVALCLRVRRVQRAGPAQRRLPFRRPHRAAQRRTQQRPDARPLRRERGGGLQQLDGGGASPSCSSNTPRAASGTGSSGSRKAASSSRPARRGRCGRGGRLRYGGGRTPGCPAPGAAPPRRLTRRCRARRCGAWRAPARSRPARCKAHGRTPAAAASARRARRRARPWPPQRHQRVHRCGLRSSARRHAASAAAISPARRRLSARRTGGLVPGGPGLFQGGQGVPVVPGEGGAQLRHRGRQPRRRSCAEHRQAAQRRGPPAPTAGPPAGSPAA